MRAAAKSTQLWIGIALSALCVVGLAFVVDGRAVVAALRQAHGGYVALTALFLVAYLLLRALRWRYLCQNRPNPAQIFHIQNIGYMLSQLLPLRLGDVARAMLIGQTRTVTVPQGLATMVVERVLDMALIVLLLPVALPAVPGLPVWMRSAAWLSSILSLTALALLVLVAQQQARARRAAAAVLARLAPLRSDRWLARFDELLHGLATLGQWRSTLTLLALSVVTWLPVVLAYRSAMAAVDMTGTWAGALFVACAGALAVAAPSSPGQVGVFHVGVTAALTWLGQPATAAVTLAVLYHAVNFAVMVGLGLGGVLATDLKVGAMVAAVRALRRAPSPGV